jgi:hypothetical protein
MKSLIDGPWPASGWMCVYCPLFAYGDVTFNGIFDSSRYWFILVQTILVQTKEKLPTEVACDRCVTL